jgi:RND family efflux transporter MFP subunit
VPVEVARVESRPISSYIETNGTLEAENEVDLVARISGPIVELAVEEGMEVQRGDLLARIDDRELRAQAEVSRVSLEEAKLVWERSKSMLDSGLISREVWEQAITRYETAKAQYESELIQLGYTEIRAPFDALIVTRYVHLAEHVAVNAPLFRVSDFEPLLCPIQVPEKDVSKLRVGQRAYLVLEAWPERRFAARVLRIRPVVDVATGTVRVTLEVASKGMLRPGMFARIFVETERRAKALVIPKAALSLESIGDTVFVAQNGAASRREVTLGFREGDFVEVTSGLAEGERIVVFGQDGLADGTPIQVLGGEPSSSEGSAVPVQPPARPEGAGPSQPTPEQIKRMKERMRERGLSEEEIEERLRRRRERSRG